MAALSQSMSCAPIEASGVVAVIRLHDARPAAPSPIALADGGVRALEVTMTVPARWRSSSSSPRRCRRTC